MTDNYPMPNMNKLSSSYWFIVFFNDTIQSAEILNPNQQNGRQGLETEHCDRFEGRPAVSLMEEAGESTKSLKYWFLGY
jgi:hypothetical protein